VTHRRTQIGELLVVHWSSVTVDECQQLAAWVASAAAGLGREVYYVAVTDAATVVPGPAERRALIAGLAQIAPLCHAVHLVLGGRGIRHAMMRSVSAGLLLASNPTRPSFRIHDELDASLRALSPVMGLPLNQLRERLGQAGFG